MQSCAIGSISQEFSIHLRKKYSHCVSEDLPIHQLFVEHCPYASIVPSVGEAMEHRIPCQWDDLQRADGA